MTPEFVAVGHVTLDETETGTRPGGAALYAALTAHRLGCSVGLLTSFAPDFPRDVFPPALEVVRVPSRETTRFRHEAGRAGRALTLLGRATEIEAEHLPEAWKEAALAMLCPVAGEVDPRLAAEFSGGAVAAAVQGWVRARGARGAVTPARWKDAPRVLPHVQALFVSQEDVGAFRQEAVGWFQRIPLGVITLGSQGALLWVSGERYTVEAAPADEVDPIGAGDVFAAAFLIDYQRGGDPWEAAAYAACAAALRVSGRGLAAIPSEASVRERLRAYRRRQGA